MQIGELAKLSNTSAKTIRFYEDSGLLPPPARTESGYRDYGPEFVDRLRFIHRGQAAGLTLQKVRQAVPAPGAQAGYPDSDFGRNLAEVARLAKAGVGMEVACVDLEGWDMHKALGSAANAQDDFSKRSRDFAAALAAFRRDLGDRWADTTIVTMSEFGRRVGENGSGGLDHGQGNTMFVAGGGVRGGRVYGSVPSLAGSNLPLGDVPISLDYRQALSEIVAKRLGNGAKVAEVFPGFTPGAALGVV